MATKIGSDTTLINAAFAEAKSKYGGDFIDQSNLFQSTVDISKTYMNIVSTTMNKILKDTEDKEKLKKQQRSMFDKIAEENIISLYADEEPLPDGYIDAVVAGINQLQEKFDAVNTIGKDDTEENKSMRRRIMGELKRMTSGTRKTRQFMMDSSDMITTRFLDERLYGSDLVDEAKIIFDLKSYNQNIADGKLQIGYDNGFFYNVRQDDGTMVTITQDMLKEMFKPINKDLDAQYSDLLLSSTERGTLDGADPSGLFKYDEYHQMSLFKDIIKTEEDFDDFAYRSIDGLNDEKSFHIALLSNADNLGIPLVVLDNMFYYNENNEKVDIGTALKVLDISGPKGTPDGIIDDLDEAAAEIQYGTGSKELQMFEDGIKTMIDALVNYKNPAFNFELSRDLMAQYYTTFDKKNYTNGFNHSVEEKRRKDFYYNQRNSGSDSGDEAVQIGDGSWIKHDSWIKHKNFILNPRQGDRTSFKNWNFKYENNQHYVETTDADQNSPTYGEIIWKPISEQELIDMSKVNNLIDLPRSDNFDVEQGGLNFSFHDYKNKSKVVASNFVGGDPSEVARILNSHYGLKTNIMQEQDGEIIIYDKDGWSSWSIKTKNDVKKLLRYLASPDFRATVPDVGARDVENY